MHKFKTTNIKGKDYVEVNQRLLYFRNEPTFAGWSIESDLVDLQPDRCCIKAIIRDADGRIRATGHAHEDRTSSMINKTSYVENCETSAFGRALAALGIGIETSIASANEVSMAIAKQEQLSDLTDKLGLVPSYDDLTVATLKADFLKLVQKLPADQQERFLKDIDQLTPARFDEVSMAIAKQEQLSDLTDKLGLVPSYDDLTVATLKADFLKLVKKLPADQQERYMKDLDQMTPARFEKGIAFIQNQLSKK